MPDGDCALGAENKANVAAQGRELGEIKVRLTSIETTVEELVVVSAVQAWKIGVIIGLIVLVVGSFGETILAPIVANIINGGG